MIILHVFKEKSRLDYIKILTYKLYCLHHDPDKIDVTGDSLQVGYGVKHLFLLKCEAVDYIKNIKSYDYVYAYDVIFDEMLMMYIKAMTDNETIYL